MKFWCSWYQVSDDPRPLKELPEEIGYWWISGYASPNSATLCALLWADSEEALKQTVQQFWPEFTGAWRFCDEVEDDWLPGSRFPIKDNTNEPSCASLAAESRCVECQDE